MNKEIFKQIPGHLNYEIGSKGNLRSIRTGRLLKSFDNPDGFIVGVFKSRLNASQETGIGRKRIEKSINRNKPYAGYIWA